MRIVVGILRDSRDKLQSYIDQGYHVEYLDEHARIYAEKIMKAKLSVDGIKKAREHGYKISSYYWVNLALLSAKNKERIVIADLQEEDNKRFFSKIL